MIYQTRLDGFLGRVPFSAARLARVADLSAQHVSELRRGGKNLTPTPATIERLRLAASQLLGREVTVSELFDVAAPPADRGTVRVRRGR